jgi:microcystin-dependent protein
MLSGSAPNFQLAVIGTTQLSAVNQQGNNPGTGDQQVSISIGGLYRYVNSGTVTCTVSGAAGNYDIFVTTSGANSYTASVDSSPAGFSMVSVASGSTPTGVYAYRKVATVAWNGTAITQLTQLVGQPNLASLLASPILPTGLGPLPWSGSAAPTGWLICDGSQVAQATYPALYGVIGTLYNADYLATHGTAVSAGNFALPDMRARTAVGPDNMGSAGAAGRATALTAGAGGGEATHVLTIGEAPSHNHGGATGSGSTGSGSTGGGSASVGPTGEPTWEDGGVYNPNGAMSGNEWEPFILAGTSAVEGGTFISNDFRKFTGFGHTHAIPAVTIPALSIPSLSVGALSISSQGGGAAHNNLPPYLTVRSFIIKA